MMIDYNQLAFKFSPAPLVVLRYRHIVEMNTAFARMFGYSKEELINLSIVKIFPSVEDFEKIGQDALNSLRRQNSRFYSDQRFMQHKSGELFWTHTHGQTLTPDDPFQLMVWHFERKDRILHATEKLTKRETEITQHIVNGLTCKEIARKLNLSHRTIEVHKANLMKKLEVHSKAELTSKIIIQEHL
ncbi:MULTISPECIES: LuxR C-terminal-related transcriptional regulator [unclassified Acinetobacter]|uniref:LuxR C-terminal-related transcriptional regulator n=1 Tax=unclassified Acinetobacter TaxID=196816 RepID=UPI00293459AF|nr:MULTISPECIES: LuxR C-terminal-related transcriptional regulator [unclassified Acinetobacter]WOE30769.1 LuxR C-terminal-related transcriptional regulator [Acinetobacter sp. SAAs470]WOE38962.1 LuxR C-terminal-related transcriptional regulator [Acinetobacter sp. SAAs474]